MVVQALGEHYFEDTKFPLNICRVNRDAAITHEYDLTEIEHTHDFVELAFIVKGKGVQVIETQEYEVSTGDIFVLQGNQKHYFKNASNLEIINVMFSTKFKQGFVSSGIKQLEGYRALFLLESRFRAEHHFKNKLHLDRKRLLDLEYLLNTMMSEQSNKRDGYKIILTNKLQELIVLLSRYYSSLDATEAQALIRISKVLDHLEQTFQDKLYLDTLADIACMSTRNFQRVFRKAVGVSPTQYIMQIRLKEAKKLLLMTNQSIADIAVVTGFNDANYFIKCFKSHYEITPLKFRMQSSEYRGV